MPRTALNSKFLFVWGDTVWLPVTTVEFELSAESAGSLLPAQLDVVMTVRSFLANIGKE